MGRLGGCSPSALTLTLLLGCGEPSLEPIPAAHMPPGMWADTRFAPGAAELSPEERQRLEALGMLGYASALEAPARETGATRHVAAPAGGPLLYTSGHASEAHLIADDGSSLHVWSFAFEDLPGGPRAPHPTQLAWRRVRALEDGSLLAIHDGIGLLKLDRDSRVLWWHPGGEHHDLHVRPDGAIWTLTRHARSHPGLGGAEVLDDCIALVSPEGELLAEHSLSEALLRDDRGDLLEAGLATGGDLLHANSVSPAGPAFLERFPELPAGTLLVSAREPSAVLAWDPAQQRVVKVWQGPFVRQHDVRTTEEGFLLMFDNLGSDGWSRALEWDPREGRIRWEWGGGPGRALFSTFCGAAQRLPGGTTLITESMAGAAYEVDREGALTWEFQSPHRSGPEGRLVGCLFELQRLPRVPPGLLP